MAIMVANVYGSCLQVKILSVHSVFDKTQDVVVEMQYNNTSNDTISIYKWCLPNNELNDPLFKVTCNNVPVNYVGPLIKRREPTIEDMISLEACKTKIIQARLSSAYDMTKTGIYSIQYDMSAERIVFKHARTFESTLVRDISKSQSGLQSNIIELTIEGRPNRQREQIVIDTYDYAYGQMASTSLALSTPSKAIMNADSHEYFAENLPVLL
ncbi:unnamed protein product [Rotaria sp. Silwood2]|nr:unnamed protein product [Rotaria sp. Silwood2]CAF4507818.1 unnamed protein product [Rotaria sp. Silwood2]